MRIGIDIGGTKCLGLAVDDGGRVVASHQFATPGTAERIVEVVADLVERLESCEASRANGGAVAVGIGAAGLVDTVGAVHISPNVAGLDGFALRERLATRLDRVVVVDNDATCATLAEWLFGAGRGTQHLVMVTLGTGIGGGVVAGGALQRGQHGYVGEFGHMVVDPTGPPCVCGRAGCWERYGSGAGLAALGRQAARLGSSSRLAALADGGDLSTLAIADAARSGDTGAEAVIDEFARWVALGLVNLVNSFDPSRVVIGGGLIAIADLFYAPVQRWFGELLYGSQTRPVPEIRLAELGAEAGAIGAAFLAAPWEVD